MANKPKILAHNKMLSAAVTPTRLFSFWADDDDAAAEGLLTQLGTVQPDGRPYVRTMNCAYDKAGNTFKFSTHAMSSKVQDIKLNNHVSLQFFYKKNQRQVVVAGDAYMNTPEENQAQWAERTQARKLLSWKSRLPPTAAAAAAPEEKEDMFEYPIVPFFCGFVVKPIAFDFSERTAEGRRVSVHMEKSLYDNTWYVKQRLILNRM
jgi:pyridoxine/pyridoxamine 5'-phosphate oxidase